MLLWLTIIVTVVLIVLVAICNNSNNFGLSCMIEFLAIVMSIVLFIMSIIGLCMNAGIEGEIAKYDARYDSLVYQLENDIYDNDNDLGKRELYSDIQAWNEDLAWYKANQDDFWIGVFIPNIYDQFEFIELK